MKYIKFLPFTTINLPKPDSSLVEKLVLYVHSQLEDCYRKDRVFGAVGTFNYLLKKVLTVISGSESGAQGLPQLLRNLPDPELRYIPREWREVAATLLNDYNSGSGWLRPVHA